jgi:phosphatidylserine decarboxylase
LFGQGPNGFISLIYVGAFNVGSINFTFDKAMKSNVKRPIKETNQLNMVRYDSPEEEVSLKKKETSGLYLSKGTDMGCFNFGSTIVMICEVDKEAKILV